MEEQKPPAAPGEGHQQQEWEPPVIEELDFGATEAAYVPGAPEDLGVYSF